jgi:hypothetical protein
MQHEQNGHGGSVVDVDQLENDSAPTALMH